MRLDCVTHDYDHIILPFFPGYVNTTMSGRRSQIGLDDRAKVLQYQLEHLAATLNMGGVSAGHEGMELRQN